MLPAWLQTPAALLLVVSGLVSCFAGYRVFRVVLGIYGFILGALMASSFMGTDQTLSMIVAALAGGLVGAAILVLAYFVGVALIGAGAGALLANAIWTSFGREPGVIVVVVMAIVGALGAGLATLRNRDFDRVRRGVDGDCRWVRARWRSGGGARRGTKRRLARVSVRSRARTAMGDRRVAGGRRGRCAGAARPHRQGPQVMTATQMGDG